VTEVHIRDAVADDCETIAGFQEAMALETEGKPLGATLIRDGVSNAFADPDKGFYLLAETDGTVAGSLFVTKEWSDWRDGWFWWIQSVFVPTQFRRRGVYRALHQEVRARAKAKGGVIGIRLYVERENDRAQETYRTVGMSATPYLLFEEEFDR
jgi:ribosomal protein S18 acetylase RimI-like enzyme